LKSVNKSTNKGYDLITHVIMNMELRLKDYRIRKGKRTHS